MSAASTSATLVDKIVEVKDLSMASVVEGVDEPEEGIEVVVDILAATTAGIQMALTVVEVEEEVVEVESRLSVIHVTVEAISRE